MYPVWPATLADPQSPINYERPLPLAAGSSDSMGKLTSERRQTRKLFKGGVTVNIEASLFQTFLTFWRDTLFQGKHVFTADWISDLGHPEYVGKIVNFDVTMKGVEPLVKMEMEFLPDVKLDPTDTFPDPWPAP